MKKIITMLIALLIILTLVGCGKSKVEELGYKALDIIEKYNVGDMSKEDAKERLDNIYDTLEKMELDNDNDKLTALHINSAIVSFDYATMDIGNATTTYEVEDNLRERLE